jgi:hypothetical protein
MFRIKELEIRNEELGIKNGGRGLGNSNEKRN